MPRWCSDSVKSISPAIAWAVTAATLVVAARVRREEVDNFVLNDRRVHVENDQILASGVQVAFLNRNIHRQAGRHFGKWTANEIGFGSTPFEGNRGHGILGNASNTVDVAPVVGDNVRDLRDRFGHQPSRHHRDLEMRNAKIAGRGAAFSSIEIVQSIDER